MNTQPHPGARARQPVVRLDTHEIQGSLDTLARETRARAVYLVHRDGQLLASGGEPELIDPTSLGALIASNIAASGAIAGLLEEMAFPTQFLEGDHASVYCHLVGPQLILVVIIDARSALGLVRLRAKRASDEINASFERAASGAPDPSEIDLDGELEGLFPD